MELSLNTVANIFLIDTSTHSGKAGWVTWVIHERLSDNHFPVHPELRWAQYGLSPARITSFLRGSIWAAAMPRHQLHRYQLLEHFFPTASGNSD